MRKVWSKLTFKGFSKHLAPNALCPICFTHEETVEHLFLLCHWSSLVWFGLSLGEVPTPVGLTTITQWWATELKKAEFHPEGWRCIMARYAISLWNIWLERNKVTFDGGIPSPQSTVIRSLSLISEVESSSTHSLSIGQPAPQSGMSRSCPAAWRPPLEGTLKINTDAAFNKQNGKGFGGIIIRDHLGNMLAGHSTSFHAFSSLSAEAIVLREGVSLAYNLDLQSVVFESDNLDLIQACRNSKEIGEISGLVEDIRSLKNLFVACGFTWTARSGNSVAHSLADLASKSLLPPNWPINPPACIRRVIFSDIH